MNILTVCEQGNNRSVQFMQLLRYKYLGSDVLPMGINSFTDETKKMLFDWADHIILTDKRFRNMIEPAYNSKVKVWDVGPDTYPRPFNPELYNLAKQIIEDNPL